MITPPEVATTTEMDVPPSTVDLGDIRLKMHEESRVHFWEYFHSSFLDGQGCDCVLLGGDGRGLPCHKLMLAALSPVAAGALEEEEDACLILPDLSHEQLEGFLRSSYAFLAGEKGDTLEVEWNVATLLEINQSWMHVAEAVEKMDEEEPVVEPEEDPESSYVMRPETGMESDLELNSASEGDDYGYGYGPRKRMMERKRRQVKKVQLEGYQPTEEDEAQFKHFCEKVDLSNGCLKVDVQQDDLKAAKHLQAKDRYRNRPKLAFNDFFHRHNSRFMGILALQNCPDGGINGAFLARTRIGPDLKPRPLAADEIASDYKYCCEGAKAVLGFSTMQIYGQSSVLYKRMEGDEERMKTHGRSKRRRHYYKRKMATYSIEQLQAMVNSLDTAQLREEKDAKAKVEAGVFEVNLVSELTALDAFLFVTYNLDGQMVGRNFEVNDDDRFASAKVVVNTLFDVWTAPTVFSFAAIRKICNVEDILRAVDEMELAKDEFQIATDFLKTGERPTRQLGGRETLTCADCGEVFVLRAMSDKQRYDRHVKTHFYEKFQCSCNTVIFTTPSEKTEHVRLVHLGHIKCSLCNYITPDKNTMKTHRKSMHTERVSDKRRQHGVKDISFRRSAPFAGRSTRASTV